MDFKERESGLVVPKQKSQKPEHQYGPLEIREEDKRELAVKALDMLWDAMSLTYTHGIGGPGWRFGRDYYRLFRFVGEALLGDDCPEKEQLT